MKKLYGLVDQEHGKVIMGEIKKVLGKLYKK